MIGYSYVSYVDAAQWLVIIAFCASFYMGTRVEFAYQPNGLTGELNQRTLRKLLYFSVGIGLVGTIGLIAGMSLSLGNFLNTFLASPSQFEQYFFNSSFAILWQANIAGCFLLALTKIDPRWRYAILLALLFQVSLRFAYVYLVIASVYFLVPYSNTQRLSIKRTLSIATILVLPLLYIFINSYSLEDGFSSVLAKIAPYTFGNFVVLSQISIDASLGILNPSFESLGLGSWVATLAKYVEGVTVRPLLVFSPIFLSLGAYGNTATGFSTFMYGGIVDGVVFHFFLGAAAQYLYRLSLRNIVAAAIYAGIASGLALYFATGAPFGTTRLLPAIIWIVFPVLILRTLYGPDVDRSENRRSFRRL
ncbi:MAG: hypothetical protein ACRBBR_15820 [Cellvibrionaceae bacterium]